MAKEAERLLDGAGWLPEPLRLTEADDASQAQDGETDTPPQSPADDNDDAGAAFEDEQPHVVAAE
jgi:ParB family chromosome partitioning protein